MTLIKGTLLDSPRVTLDDRIVKLPYRKVEAAFYYLLVMKRTTRDELIGLLWADFPEDIARKNLRNALYQLRKALGVDVILAPGQTEVFLNPEVKVITDLDQFLSDTEGHVRYKNGFLEGFMVKDASDFEDWMQGYRNRLQERYARDLRQQIHGAEAISDHQKIIAMAERLLEQTPYDEKSFRSMMRSHSALGENHRSIQVYEAFCQILKKELGIQPEMETQQLFKKMMAERNKNGPSNRIGNGTTSELQGFYGREKELVWLEEVYSQSMRHLSPQLVLLSGEAGVGKTLLLQVFLSKQNLSETQLISANCYQQEESYLLRPWQPVFSALVEILEKQSIPLPSGWICQMMKQFPSFELLYHKRNLAEDQKAWEASLHQPLVEAAVGIIKRIASVNKIVLSFEDIHWMDQASQQLLLRVLKEPSLNVLIMATARDGYVNKIVDLKAIASRKGSLKHLEIERFTQKETLQWLHATLRNLTLTNEESALIFEETGGNPFFVSEYINALKTHGDSSKLSVKAKDILQSRLMELPKEVQKLLELTSLFFHRVPLSLITNVSSAYEDQVIEMLQQLFNQGILKEVWDGGKISIQFVHHKFREFVYENQSESKRRHLHHRVGVQLEKGLTGKNADLLRYTDLIHHFKASGNYAQALVYSMLYLNGHLDYYHELFPSTIQPEHLARQSLYMDRKETTQYFDEVEKIMSMMTPDEFYHNDVIMCKISYLHLKGRLLIREGNYKQGIPSIKEMVTLAEANEKWDYAVYGHQQLTNYGIQTQQPEVMKEHINKAMKIAVTYFLQELVPVLLRLKGLYLLMIHNFEEAEKTLQKAVEVVDVRQDSHRQYGIHMAACQYYLGEIRRNQGKHEEAVAYYQKAVNTFRDNHLEHHAVAVFYTGMGQAYMELKDYQEAERCLQWAMEYYRKYDVYWRRSIASVYLGLINATRGESGQAVNYMKQAVSYANLIKNPYEMSVVERIGSDIKSKIGDLS